MMRIFTNKFSGFTLIEMAIVLVIIGFILGGLLVSLTAQTDLRNYAETRKTLEDSKEALVGFTLNNRHLPCPDKTTGANNGINDNPNDGIEDFNAATGNCVVVEGNLPWSTLSLTNTDAWGQAFIYRVSTAFSQRSPLNTFNLTMNGNIRICNEAACSTPPLTSNAIAVVISRGKNRSICSTLPSLPACADERANDDNNNDFVSHEPRVRTLANPNGEYDDFVVWLSSSILMNRMVAAGQLP